MPEVIFEITLREAMHLLEERIKINPQTFLRAVGGKRMYAAIVALLEYVKSLPVSEQEKKIAVKIPEYR